MSRHPPDAPARRQPDRHDERGDHDDGVEGGHRHRGGALQAFGHAVGHAVRPHSHDSAERTDAVMESRVEGVRAVRMSLVALTVTALAQAAVTVWSGSVALAADTIHNLSDGLTALPLWLAFALSARPASRRFTYGLGRVEDVAGLFVVLVIALSAGVAGWESLARLRAPRPVDHLAAVMAAGIIGCVGNEAVAVYRVRTGGRHARADGFTSLGVVLGAVGVAAGWRAADPAVGLVITVAILAVLGGAIRDVGRRLLDGVDPRLVAAADEALRRVPGVLDVEDLRLRWLGHRLHAEARLVVDGDHDVASADRLVAQAAEALQDRLPQLERVALRPGAAPPA